MASMHHVCPECGAPIAVGLANCPDCGTQVGTVFSETDVRPRPQQSPRHRPPSQTDVFQQIDKAKEQANTSLILSLVTFFCPGIGLFMGLAALYLGYRAITTLRANNVEEGTGVATAGLIIAALGLVAQGSYILYFINMGLSF
ncbi:MAG TPA: DUF4190 domain-containing protein [Blastocatellia bacterium]|nr:DUF4190 domain-containing protein [Blastocatellia bacterium]